LDQSFMRARDGVENGNEFCMPIAYRPTSLRRIECIQQCLGMRWPLRQDNPSRSEFISKFVPRFIRRGLLFTRPPMCESLT
jgi:hypothetical protein